MNWIGPDGSCVKIHVCANYVARPAEVFVAYADIRLGWRRVPRKRAEADPHLRKRIVRCSRCSAYAVTIDHHFPWDHEYNLCKKHAKEEGLL